MSRRIQFRVRRRNRVRRRKVNRIARRKMFTLLARKNGSTLYYTGAKFAKHGKPVLFQNTETARVVAKVMRLQYPYLKSYAMYARAV